MTTVNGSSGDGSARTTRIPYLRSRLDLIINRNNRNRPRWTLLDAYEVRAALNELEALRAENKRMRRILFRNKTATAIRSHPLGGTSSRLQRLK